MTVAEADDAMREALVAALEPVHLCDNMGTFTDQQELADALLPTVRALIADELRAAAEDLADDEESDPAYIASADLLNGRAAALDPR